VSRNRDREKRGKPHKNNSKKEPENKARGTKHSLVWMRINKSLPFTSKEPPHLRTQKVLYYGLTRAPLSFCAVS